MKKNLYVIFLCTCMALWAVCFLCGCSGREELTFGDDGPFGTEGETKYISGADGSSTQNNSNVGQDSKITSVFREVVVYVCGAVEQPGVISLPEGSRINDAVKMAGGMTEDAAVNHINLATKLKDGEQIYVPTLEEIQREEEQAREEALGIVDLNSADLEKLCTLPGVGESKARDIILYREQNDGFKSIEEIMNIPGIKDSLFQKIKDLIVVK